MLCFPVTTSFRLHVDPFARGEQAPFQGQSFNVCLLSVVCFSIYFILYFGVVLLTLSFSSLSYVSNYPFNVPPPAHPPPPPLPQRSCTSLLSPLTSPCVITYVMPPSPFLCVSFLLVGFGFTSSPLVCPVVCVCSVWSNAMSVQWGSCLLCAAVSCVSCQL